MAFFFSYFLNNKRNPSSSIFHTFFFVFCPYILCSQNYFKIVPKQPPPSPAILPAPSAAVASPAAAAAPHAFAVTATALGW